MELGKVLAPLADFREKMLFIRGLYNAEALKGNIHSSQTGNLLSGAPLASGGEIRSGTSFDQCSPRPTAARPRCPAWCWAARSRTRRSTRTTRCSTARTSPGARRPRRRRWSCIRRWPSTGCSRTRSSAATRACSTPCSPTPATSAAQISTADQRKLDEYLDSVREVEQRIERAGKQGELQGWRPTLDKPNIPRPADGIPQNIADHMRLMCDILVLGFQTDTTRVTHAQAEQRPLVAALPAPGRRLHDPPPAVALRHGRLAEGEPVLRRAGRLHRPQARRDSGRRAARRSTTR